MQNKNLISIFFLFQNLVLFAQPSIEWQKCLGGTGYDRPTFLQPSKDMIQQTADSGFIIIGVTDSDNGAGKTQG